LHSLRHRVFSAGGSEAAGALEQARRFKPDLTMRFVLEVLPITDPDFSARFTDGLRKAGLRE